MVRGRPEVPLAEREPGPAPNAADGDGRGEDEVRGVIKAEAKT